MEYLFHSDQHLTLQCNMAMHRLSLPAQTTT